MSADPVSDLLWAELDAAEVLQRSAWDQHANEALAHTLAAGEHAYTDDEWAAFINSDDDDAEPDDDEDKSMKPWKLVTGILAVLVLELFLLAGTSYMAYRAGGWSAVFCWWALLIAGMEVVAHRAGGRR